LSANLTGALPVSGFELSVVIVENKPLRGCAQVRRTISGKSFLFNVRFENK